MQVYLPTIPIIKESARYSLTILPAPVQSPSMLMNKREERRNYKYQDRPISLVSISSNPTKPQQINYETMATEIDFLTEKLCMAEEKVYKWKKEFKELHIKFMQMNIENIKIKEELDTTRRMLEESEHIRSRWYIKRPQEMTENTRKSPPPQQQQHQSLPNNLLRFLKLNNTRKPLL